MSGIKKFIKSTLFLIASVMLLTIGFSAAAENTVYRISEMELEISFPDYYHVITRSSSPDKDILDDYGLSPEELSETFIKNNIYINALSADEADEIVVIMSDVEFPDFTRTNSIVLDGFAASLSAEYKKLGITVNSYEIYRHTQTPFIVINLKNYIQGVHALQYYTIHNGKAMNFTLRSYDGEISDTLAADFKEIINSIHLTSEAANVPEPEKIPSFLYEETNSGITFTVPENWAYKEISKETYEKSLAEVVESNKEYFDSEEDARRVAEKTFLNLTAYINDGNVIGYTCCDMYATYSETDTEFSNRSEIDNEFFEASNWSFMTGTDKSELKTEKIGDYVFYKSESEVYEEISGIEFHIPMITYVCVVDGYMHSFVYTGLTDSEFYDDFIELMNSINIPELSALTIETPSVTSIYDTPRKTVSPLVRIIMIYLVIPGIISVIIIFSVTRKRKKARTEISESVLSGTYCTNCGARIEQDSKFCHICGQKINNSENDTEENL